MRSLGKESIQKSRKWRYAESETKTSGPSPRVVPKIDGYIDLPMSILPVEYITIFLKWTQQIYNRLDIFDLGLKHYK